MVLMAESALIELKNIACERDDRVLFNGVNVAFNAGQLVQILGANGSGKTTLLRVIAGVSQDYHGEILWRGQPRGEAAWEYAHESLYLGHLSGIKKSLTPLENLRWYAAIQGGDSDEALLAALVTVKLAGYQDTPCYQLSAGQLRRVALARLVFSRALLWILDEPFTALDKAGVEQLESRLTDHVSRGGLVLMTSHQDIQVPNLVQLDLHEFSAELRLGER
jgi:heme exporter protein A